jgi:hypothetical protein
MGFDRINRTVGFRQDKECRLEYDWGPRGQTGLNTRLPRGQVGLYCKRPRGQKGLHKIMRTGWIIQGQEER